MMNPYFYQWLYVIVQTIHICMMMNMEINVNKSYLASVSQPPPPFCVAPDPRSDMFEYVYFSYFCASSKDLPN